MHEGPQPLPPKRVPIPSDLPQKNDGATVKTGPSPFRWTSLELSDRHGLWGGRSIAVSSIGDYELIDTGVHTRSRRYRATVEHGALVELDALIARHPPPSNEPLPPPANMLPDSVSASLVLVIDGRETHLSRRTDAEFASFGALQDWLLQVARKSGPCK